MSASPDQGANAARVRIINEARRWIGTPYRHQGSRQGAGCDCLGLVRGVWRSVYGQEPERMPHYTADWGEPGGDEVLWRAAARHFKPRPRGHATVPGDLLLFRMRAAGVAKHLGIAAASASGPTFIHAMSGYGVVESPLSAPWARRIAAEFVFPERT